ncbi:MAG TPA: hypothetical protein PKE03_11910 [Bacteroidales bacterium]|nr:hypothetical protein [Bacteroidales bacterium]
MSNSMKKTSAITALILCMMMFSAGAQQLSDFRYGKYDYYDYDRWGFGLMLSKMANPGVPFPKEHSKSYISLKIDWKNYHLGKGERRFYWQNKSIGDLFSLLELAVQDGSNINRKEETTLSHFIGFASWGWNINKAGKSSIAAGFNINDFILGSYSYERTAQGLPVNGKTREPHGLYYGIGPSVFYDYALSEGLIIQSLATFSFNAFRLAAVSDAAEKDKDYPKPHLGQISVELLSAAKINAGIDYTWIMDRGANHNKARRFDLILSYRF